MKNLLFLLLLIFNISIFSQTSNNQSINILSLNECLIFALQNAPELNISNSQIEQVKFQKEAINTFWLFDNMAISGSSQFVYRRHFNNTAGGGYDPEENIGTYFGPQSNNNVGLSLNIPLNSFKLKKYAKKEANEAIKEMHYAKDVQIQNIKQQVITLYHEFENASNRLRTASKLLDIEKTFLNLAEENKQTTQLAKEEYLNVLRAKINAENEYNASKIEYEAIYYALKLRVGTEILK